MGKIIQVREIGDPVLKNISEEIDINNINNDVLDIIEDLKSTLEYGTGLGIAAPQIGINKRIIVVGAKKENIKYNDAEEIPITAMINPSWRKISDDTDIQFEGCMSIPSIRGKVRRYKDIELTYYDEKGEKHIKELHGFFARLIQHECDHLDGITFIEKVVNEDGFATKENMNKYKLREKEYIQNTCKVITLCGSIKFKDEFLKIQEKLTLEGNIVFIPNFLRTIKKEEITSKFKEMLDTMHRQKIDMSDEIFVINVDGYIGESTKSEIEYALKKGKTVRYEEEFE